MNELVLLSTITAGLIVSPLTVSTVNSYALYIDEQPAAVARLHASGPESMFVENHKTGKRVVLHADGRITYKGGFKSEGEVLRFLMETMASMYFPLKNRRGAP